MDVDWMVSRAVLIFTDLGHVEKSKTGDLKRLKEDLGNLGGFLVLFGFKLSKMIQK